MTSRKIRDYQRNRKLKGIVDANFKTFATVAIALKHLFPHDWYNKTITDFTTSYAEFTKHMNDYDAEAYDFRVKDFCRKLNISDSDTYDIIFRLNGKPSAVRSACPHILASDLRYAISFAYLCEPMLQFKRKCISIRFPR